MIDIFFIRHGATEGNLRRRYIGRTDEPLCEAGIAQVKALQKRRLSVDRLFVSPMLRTRQTADILFPKMHYTVVDSLAETDFGRFEGKSADELSGDPAYQAWVDAMCLTPIPEGESVTDFKTRCCEAFTETIKNVQDGSRVGFVVHGGVIMAIMEAYERPKKDFYAYHIGNGEWLQGVYDGETIQINSEHRPHSGYLSGTRTVSLYGIGVVTPSARRRPRRTRSTGCGWSSVRRPRKGTN